MNAVWSEVFQALPMLIQMAESFAPQAGAGAQKAAAVATALTQIVPSAVPMIRNSPDGAARLQNAIAVGVSLMNSLAPLFAQQQAATQVPVVPVAPSGIIDPSKPLGT